MEELVKQNSVMKSNHESIIRSLRAETKVKIDLFSALSEFTKNVLLLLILCQYSNPYNGGAVNFGFKLYHYFVHNVLVMSHYLLGVARRETDELKLTMENCKRENDMLKKRIAEAMAVSSFPTASFTTTQASDTFYSANGY